MFPSTHDITPKNLSECLVVINRLLDAGNKVLIVSKPQWCCITVICESIKVNFPNFWQNKVTFRFTTGSTSDAVLKFWEPNAPGFTERWACLKYAYEAGFDTSVSCEPYLDAHPEYVYAATESLVTDKIWVGMLRDFDNRVVMDSVTLSEKAVYVKPLKALQNPMFVKTIYNNMKELPKIEWKDSIREVLNLEKN